MNHTKLKQDLTKRKKLSTTNFYSIIFWGLRGTELYLPRPKKREGHKVGFYCRVKVWMRCCHRGVGGGLVLHRCFHRCFASSGFPEEKCSVGRWSVLFSLTVSDFNVMAGQCLNSFCKMEGNPSTSSTSTEQLETWLTTSYKKCGLFCASSDFNHLNSALIGIFSWWRINTI